MPPRISAAAVPLVANEAGETCRNKSCAHLPPASTPQMQMVFPDTAKYNKPRDPEAAGAEIWDRARDLLGAKPAWRCETSPGRRRGLRGRRRSGRPCRQSRDIRDGRALRRRRIAGLRGGLQLLRQRLEARLYALLRSMRLVDLRRSLMADWCWPMGERTEGVGGRAKVVRQHPTHPGKSNAVFRQEFARCEHRARDRGGALGTLAGP